MSSPGPSATRRTLRRLHRWIGFGLGLWFVVAGVTGSILVFWRELDAPPAHAVSAGPAQPLEELRKIAARAWPPEADIFRAFPAEAPGETVRFEALVPDAAGVDRRRTLHLDPATGAVLAETVWGEGWVQFLYDLHDGKLFGSAGGFAVGIAGLVFLLLVAIGVWLWTWHDATPLREGLRPMRGLRGMRRRRNLHRSIALWAALPLAITAVTGATLSFPETTRALLAPLGATGAEALAPRAKPEPMSSPMTLDAAVERARAAFPGYRIAWMDLPPAATGEPIAFALRLGQARVEAPSRVWVDPVRGAVEAAHPSTVETLRAWFMALHNGQAFGGAHRGFVVALGLTPAFLGVTGLLIWRRRRANAARPRVAAAGAARTDRRGMGSSTGGNLFSKQ